MSTATQLPGRSCRSVTNSSLFFVFVCHGLLVAFAYMQAAHAGDFMVIYYYGSSPCRASSRICS